jgi:hypothetical protein
LDEMWLLLSFLGVVERNDEGILLTELGKLVVAPYLSGLGMDIPEVGLMTDRPLSDLVATASLWHQKRVEAEFAAWVSANGEERAVNELIASARTVTDIHERVAIVELAGNVRDHEGAVRGLLETRAGGHAMMWLLTRELEEPNDNNIRRAMMAGLEVLSLQCGGDPDDDVEVLEAISTIFVNLSPTEFFELLWRVEEPWAGDVLAAIGRLYPDKVIAKQARKAVMQHHTHLANLRK